MLLACWMGKYGDMEWICCMMLRALNPAKQPSNAGIVIMTVHEIVCYGFFLEIDTGIVVGRGWSDSQSAWIHDLQ